MKRIILSFLLSFAIVFSTEWYVDNAASGTNAGTSWTNAWESFADIGWGSVSGGDTVYISGGTNSKTYIETLTPTASGTSGNLVTVKKGIDANHNGEVIIDAENIRTYCVDLDPGPDYFTLAYITLMDATDKGVRCENTEYVTLDHITYLNAPGSGMRIVSNNNTTISYFNYSTVTNSSNQCDGMQVNYNNNFILENSTIRILNSGSGHNDGFQKNQGTGGSNGIIRNNFFDMDNTDGIDSQGIFLEDGEGTWDVYNNKVDGHEYVKALIKFKTLQSGSVLNLYNNVVISGIEASGNILNFTGTGTFVMKNNIVVVTSNNATVIAFNLTGTKTIDYNIWFGMGSSWFTGWQGNGYDANGDYIDPDLTASYESTDSLSPPVDNGTTIGSFSDDIVGISRPQGGAWDIGAYEFEGSAPAPPAPGPEQSYLLFTTTLVKKGLDVGAFGYYLESATIVLDSLIIDYDSTYYAIDKLYTISGYSPPTRSGRAYDTIEITGELKIGNNGVWIDSIKAVTDTLLIYYNNNAYVMPTR